MTATPSAESNLTPLMRQYGAIKAQNPDTVLLYRMGDFYELFNEDAKIASKVLGLTLTSRNHGGTDNTPLAGFPYHALDRYANRLVKAGYKIAICEQVEDPKTAKGLVKRDVVEVITAGTATEDNFIEEKSNNFIVSLCQGKNLVGLSICDLSTGQFYVEEVDPALVLEELVRIDPSEVVCADTENNPFVNLVRDNLRSVMITRFEGWKFSADHATEGLRSHFAIASLQALGLEQYSCGIGAAGALLLYLKDQKRNDLKHIVTLVPRSLCEYVELDPATIRNLEILRPLHAEDSGQTLCAALDSTSTAMGARMLKRWLALPLKNIQRINERLDCVEWLKKELFTREELSLILRQIADIERLISKVTVERANARDLVALKTSLRALPRIEALLNPAALALLAAIRSTLSGFEELAEKIAATIAEAPPLSIKDGGIIRPGVSAELDTIRDAAVNGKQWIAALQESERVRTGIGSLKVGYNRVFGYYIEITNANQGAVPENYIRKQTLTNGERYITPELKQMEDTILGAEEKHKVIEYELFTVLRRAVATECARIQKAADAIASLDVFVSLAAIAANQNYCRPRLNDSADMTITDGRHPVVERINPSDQFVPNSTEFRSEDRQILLITGPNMAGKSTYLRQNACIAIMAQIGSFVPAAQAEIGVVDKIFTRVGASDRLARGQSTFLIEMIEVANILNNATDKSLVLLDEVGRGTSTFDGISIAWAVAEYLHETPNRNARTLFATHYHELTEMSLIFSRIKNLHVKVKEWNDQIIFLRKIDEGSCDHSYGIQVARLAGVPKAVILRAREILANLEGMELTPDHKPVLAQRSTRSKKSVSDAHDELSAGIQMNVLDALNHELIQDLKQLDINTITPLQALTILSELKKKAVL